MTETRFAPRRGANPSASERATYRDGGSRMPGVGTYVTLTVWVMAVLLAIEAGAFEGGAQPPIPLMLAVTAPIAAVAVAYRTSQRFRDYVLDLDMRVVLGVQLWRVVGIAFLFALAFDRLPAGFAVPAGVGDIATGIAAIAVVAALVRGTLTKSGFYAFTSLGIGDFLVAIIAGLGLRPPELDLWPLIIFPTLMVPFFGVAHLISILQYRRTGRGRVARVT